MFLIYTVLSVRVHSPPPKKKNSRYLQGRQQTDR